MSEPVYRHQRYLRFAVLNLIAIKITLLWKKRLLGDAEGKRGGRKDVNIVSLARLDDRYSAPLSARGLAPIAECRGCYHAYGQIGQVRRCSRLFCHRFEGY